jgi:hypothetical protein
LKRARTIWISRGWQPAAIGYVPNKAAWDRTAKAQNFDAPWKEPTPGGGWAQLLSNSRDAVVLVCIADKGFETTADVVLAIVHESVHVWQFIRKHIGEDEPGIEVEAYSIEAITRGLLDAYCHTQGLGKSLPVIKRGR